MSRNLLDAVLAQSTGMAVTAIASTSAHGCSGWDEDFDTVDGAAVFVRTGHVTDDELEHLEDQLLDLWPDRNGGVCDEQVVAAALLGVTVPDSPPTGSPAPLWNTEWKGTLRAWLASCHAQSVAEQDRRTAVADAMRAARLALLAREGFSPVAGRLPFVYTIVCDYGCRCLCSAGSGGDANSVLRARDGVVYQMPDRVTADYLDATLPLARAKGQEAFDAATVKVLEWCQKAIPPALKTQPWGRDPHSAVLDMTWADWSHQVTQARETLTRLAKQAAASDDWAPLVTHCRQLWGEDRPLPFDNPDVARRRAERSILEKAGIRPLTAAYVDALHKALS